MLHPILSALLEQDRANPSPPLSSVPLVDARQGFLDALKSIDSAGPDMADVTDRTIAHEGHETQVRIYTPRGIAGQPVPILMFYHGGGWIFGSIDSHDSLCRKLAHHGELIVISTDYRLAPEHKFPQPLEDCVAAYRWAVERWPGLSEQGSATVKWIVCRVPCLANMGRHAGRA